VIDTSLRVVLTRLRVVVIILLIVVGSLSGLFVFLNLQKSTSANPFIHTGVASFALVSSASVLSVDPGFANLAKLHYNFMYADSNNFSAVKAAPFILIVVSSLMANPYKTLVAPYLNGSLLSYAFRIGGVTRSYNGTWSKGQTVFILAGYPAGRLASALNAFFVRQPVALPQESFVNVTVANGTKVDPMLTANYGGYPLTPSDPYFNAASGYSYYLNFASVFYCAPWSIEVDHVKEEFAFNWSGSGPQLPHSAQLCYIDEQPSICWGVYSGVPIFSFVQGVTQSPVLDLDNQDCSFFFVHCIGVKGNVLSGYSTSYGPGYLAGEKFWAQDLQQYNAPTNLTTVKELLQAGVAVYSTPLSSVPACNWPNCSATINFTYGIYPLVTAYSNVESLDASLGAVYNYTALFEPLTLSVPSTYTDSTGTYAFEQWTVYSEVGNSTFERTYNSSSATIEVVGPTQAEAVYLPFNPPKPGLLQGKVEFYHTYGLNITGLAIQGATVEVTQDGHTVFNTTSGLDGNYSSPVLLQPGCYNITATKHGYNLQPSIQPVCIDGNTVDDIYERYYFTFWGFGPAGFGQPITANHGVQLYFELYWPDGTPVTDWPITASVNSGTIGFQSNTNNSGIATFIWTGGVTPGDFNASFSSQGLGTRPLYYTMPIAVFGSTYPLFMLNLTSASTSYSAATNSTVLIPVDIASCSPIYPQTGEYVFSCDPSQPLKVSLSVAGLPNNSSISLVPAHATSFSLLNVTVGPNTPVGIYDISISASSSPPYYYIPTITNSTNVKLDVFSCVNRSGEITGQVLNPDGRLQPNVNVTIYQNGASVFTTNSTTGLFSTGYTLKPGSYNVTVYYAGSSKIYYSRMVSVAACSQSPVTLTPMSDLITQVDYNGTPAAYANLTLTASSSGYLRMFQANSTGGFDSGYSLLPGSYDLTASVGMYNFTVPVTLTADNTTYVVINVPDPPPAAVNAQFSPSERIFG